MNNERIDVLAVMVAMMTFAGKFQPDWAIDPNSRPLGTGHIAQRARLRQCPRFKNRHVLGATPTTSTVFRALCRAERDGLVMRAGTGAEFGGWNANAAQRQEIYWRMTLAAVARIGEGA